MAAGATLVPASVGPVPGWGPSISTDVAALGGKDSLQNILLAVVCLFTCM